MNGRLIFTVLMAACACLVLSIHPAEATAPGGFVGVHGGYVEAADSDEGNFQVGGHVEFPFFSFLGIHGSVDYRLVESIRTTLGSTAGDLELKSFPVTATARVYLPSISRVSAFAGAGAGWYYLMYDYDENLEAIGFKDDETHEFGWHVAAGALVRLVPKLSIYGEGRYIFMDPKHEIDQALIDDVEDLDYDSFYIAAGVSLHY